MAGLYARSTLQLLLQGTRRTNLPCNLPNLTGLVTGARPAHLLYRAAPVRRSLCTPAPAPAPDPHTETVVARLRRIEKHLRFRGYSILKIAAGVIVVIGGVVYLFRDHLRENVAGEVSTVATLSLGDESVKLKVEEVSKALLYTLLNDANIQNEAVGFLKGLLSQPGAREATVQLLVNVLNDPVTQKKLVSSMKQLIARSLSDPTFRHNLAINLKELFDDPVTREGISQLVTHILQDEKIKMDAKVFAKEVLASELVTAEATVLARTALMGVVSDEAVRKKTGDGMWSAFTYSIKPSWGFGGKAPEDPPPPPDM